MNRNDAIDLIAATFDTTEEAAEDVVDTLAMRANIAWDPEEPEVLWECACWRLTETGIWERRLNGSLGNFIAASIDTAVLPVFEELARRLLEEHKQQEALDEHNDKLEEAEASERAAWSVMNKHQDCLDNLEANLHRLCDVIARMSSDVRASGDRLTKLEQDLLLVRGQVAHVDEREAADYLATQERLSALEEWRGAAKDALPAGVDAMREALGEPLSSSPEGAPTVTVPLEVYERMGAVWDLWGPKGELREKLAFYSAPVRGGIPWFDQLRSELLALPDEVKR